MGVRGRAWACMGVRGRVRVRARCAPSGAWLHAQVLLRPTPYPPLMVYLPGDHLQLAYFMLVRGACPGTTLLPRP